MNPAIFSPSFTKMDYQVAQGREWCSYATLFGSSTLYVLLKDQATGNSQFKFRLEGDQLLGHTFQLQEVLNGNVKKQTLTAQEF